MGVHEDIERKEGNKRSVTRLTIQWGAFYLHKNRKWVTKKILTETTSQEKLEMRHWVNPIVNKWGN